MVTNQTEEPAVAQHSPLVLQQSSLAVRVRQVEARLRGALQPILDEHGLGMDHWRIMAVLGDDPGLGMSEVAATAVVAAASLTRHVDRLVELGIVVRRVDRHDKRRAVVALSPRGSAYAARLRAAESSVEPFDLA